MISTIDSRVHFESGSSSKSSLEKKGVIDVVSAEPSHAFLRERYIILLLCLPAVLQVLPENLRGGFVRALVRLQLKVIGKGNVRLASAHGQCQRSTRPDVTDDHLHTAGEIARVELPHPRGCRGASLRDRGGRPRRVHLDAVDGAVQPRSREGLRQDHVEVSLAPQQGEQ